MKKILKTLSVFLLATATAFAMQSCFGSSSSNENSSENEGNQTTQEDVEEIVSDNQQVEFTDLRLEENAVEDGEEVLKCYFDVNLPEVKGHEIRITMSILTPDGELFTYTDQDGFGVPISDARWYEDGVVTDDWMYIANSELEHLPSGQYYLRFEAYDLTANELLGYSESIPFTK